MDGSKPGPGSPCGETQKGDSPASPQGLPGAGGTDPFLRWARRSASLFQQAGGSRHPWMWSRTSSTTASPCPLHPPALRQVPCQNFHLPHHPPPIFLPPHPAVATGPDRTRGQWDNKRKRSTNPQGHWGPRGWPRHPTTNTSGSVPAPRGGGFPLPLSWLLLPREVRLSWDACPGFYGDEAFLGTHCGCQMLLYHLPPSFLVAPIFVALLPHFTVLSGDENQTPAWNPQHCKGVTEGGGGGGGSCRVPQELSPSPQQAGVETQGWVMEGGETQSRPPPFRPPALSEIRLS